MKKILFVCLGNICRSPLAEALFKYKIETLGLTDHYYIDSCGTNGYHNGEQADERTRRNAESHGIEVDSISRQLTLGDLMDFDVILTMASDVHFQVLNFCRTQAQKDKIHLFRELDPEAPNSNVPDPWYGGEEGFEKVYQIIEQNTMHWVNYLNSRQHL